MSPTPGAVRVVFLGSADAFGGGGCLNSSYLVESGPKRLLIDCGPTSVWALGRRGLAPEDLDRVLLTHFHGDHILGLPMLFLHHQYRRTRDLPLRLAGPRGLEDRARALYRAAYASPARALDAAGLVRFEVLEPGSHTVWDGETEVRAIPMDHQEESLGYRIRIGGRVIAFTGDAMWSEDLIELGREADLLVTDCTFFDEDTPGHLSYRVLEERADRIGARRIILSHLGASMRARAGEVAFETATDGLVVTLDGPADGR